MVLAHRMANLGTESAFTVLARARELEAQGKEVIHLEIGEPDFATPKHIRDAAVRALEQGYTHYVPAPGLSEVRQSIARHAGQRRGIEVNWRQVVVTPGAKPIMFFTILALAQRGVEVIYPDPGFPIYESMIRFCGARAVPMPLLGENDYHPDLKELAKKITDRTRLIILNSPNNPCGSVLSKEEISAIAVMIRRHPNLYVLTDEVYKDILYEGSHYSIASLPGMRDRTIILDGLSKSYAMTGWRLGYSVFPEALTDHIVRLAVNSVSCATAFSQRAIIDALEGPQESVAAMKDEFQRRRQVIVEGLRSIPGISCPMPEGAFYAFANVAKTGLSSDEFERRALNEAGVALLSGKSFGRYGAGYVRFSYANSVENLQKAVGRLKSFVEGIG
ncbi:MAG: pyridoxal phosphate-dependent aminotransferase [Chloroflexi bacterium]|nr:pyridoxal phosphate-dependent aminotransferase [Chloroflexota bacterium]